jgi:hypothetical protein
MVNIDSTEEESSSDYADTEAVKKPKVKTAKPKNKKESTKSRSTSESKVEPQLKQEPRCETLVATNATVGVNSEPKDHPVAPLTKDYRNQRDTNIKVNRGFRAKPKPKPNRPLSLEVGDLVYLVSQQEYRRRRVHVEELGQKTIARVVGESCFAIGSVHEERQLQLLNLSTGERWYEPASKVTRTHFF